MDFIAWIGREAVMVENSHWWWWMPGGKLTLELQSETMIPQDLLEMLVCPVCKEPVVPKDDGTGLKCGKCGRVYPIDGDIPIMLVDAATIEPR